MEIQHKLQPNTLWRFSTNCNLTFYGDSAQTLTQHSMEIQHNFSLTLYGDSAQTQTQRSMAIQHILPHQCFGMHTIMCDIHTM